MLTPKDRDGADPADAVAGALAPHEGVRGQGVRLAGVRVLVVEDEAIVSLLLAQYLGDLGCEVAGVTGCLEEAQDLARTLVLDAAVLDVDLAGRVSYPVAELLHGRGIPFVFATGYAEPRLTELGLPDALRAVPVLVKPFRLEQLARALAAAKRG